MQMVEILLLDTMNNIKKLLEFLKQNSRRLNLSLSV